MHDYKVEPNEFTTNVIINAFGKQGQMQLMMDHFKNMTEKPSTITFNTIINAFAKHEKNLKNVTDMVALMKEKEVPLDNTTYSVS
jgi:pentatricopeptide repeat protein